MKIKKESIAVNEKCKGCDGIGVVRVTPPGFPRMDKQCPKCKGTGKEAKT